jgi:hypothetical protein
MGAQTEKEIMDGWKKVFDEDFSKNFARAWTKEELEKSVRIFNSTEDAGLRTKLFCRFINTRHIHYIHITNLGIFLTDFLFERKFGDFHVHDSRNFKIDVLGSNIVIMKKETVRHGCGCTIPYETWKKKDKIPLSKIKKVEQKENTLIASV